LCIFRNDEAELAAIKLHRFFIVPDDKCGVGDAGNHGFSLIGDELTNKRTRDLRHITLLAIIELI
jgi:hypothetical protein